MLDQELLFSFLSECDVGLVLILLLFVLLLPHLLLFLVLLVLLHVCLSCCALLRMVPKHPTFVTGALGVALPPMALAAVNAAPLILSEVHMLLSVAEWLRKLFLDAIL